MEIKKTIGRLLVGAPFNRAAFLTSLFIASATTVFWVWQHPYQHYASRSYIAARTNEAAEAVWIRPMTTTNGHLCERLIFAAGTGLCGETGSEFTADELREHTDLLALFVARDRALHVLEAAIPAFILAAVFAGSLAVLHLVRRLLRWVRTGG